MGSIEGFATPMLREHLTIDHADLEAVNTADDPDNVAPRPGQDAEVEGSKLRVSLPAHSYHVLRLGIEGH